MMFETYYRGTNNPHEPNIIASGNIKPSINHLTGKVEIGLSVSKEILTLCNYFAIIYKVTGEELQTSGSDGEILLDITTVRLAL
ncbi:MAG TPA: hypothetical protein VI911_07765 [Patescibacteria group bacterium]|nr:hypothetical protein [Patescibacteria group bacterium]